MTEATATHLQDNIVRNFTPSGLLVEYQPPPDRQYWVESREVPSVTTITDVLGKELSWWGMKVGMVGTIALVNMGEIDPAVVAPVTLDDLKDKNHPLLRLMKENGLATYQIRDKAADRGSAVHYALEEWARTGMKPDARNFPPQESGYIAAVLKFIEEVNPEPVQAELMVGSARHGYAGRFDLLADTVALEVQTGPRTKRKIPEGRGLIDLKTSSGVYKSHYLQVAGYSEALEEGGYGRTDYEAILHARDDGTYDFKVSKARFSQFLDVKRAYDALRGLK